MFIGWNEACLCMNSFICNSQLEIDTRLPCVITAGKGAQGSLSDGNCLVITVRSGVYLSTVYFSSPALQEVIRVVFFTIKHLTVIFWKWDKSIWLFVLKMMFDIFSSKGCHCPPKVSYMALMAQSTGLKYFRRKNFSSRGGNPGTGAFYLSRHNLWNCGRQNFWFFSYTSEISISSFLVKARIVFICSWKHFAI